MTELRSIRCIAFDAVGTVMHPQPSAAEAYFRIASRYGTRLTADEVARRFRQAFSDSERGDLALPDETRLVTSEDREFRRWQEIVARVLTDVSDLEGCFAEIYAHFAQPAAWRCYEEVPAVLAEIRSRGYRVALASNFDHRLHTVCDGLPALEDLRPRVISSEVGCRKPGAAFYAALVAQTGCAPGEILMVGDDFTNDVVGARQAGLAAVFVSRRRPPEPGELASLTELLPLLESRAGAP